MVTIISFIIVISVLVFFHELGHFMVARACGVYVRDFSIGMGPVIYQYKGKETTYSLRALPIGGAVQMLGEDGVDKELDETVQHGVAQAAVDEPHSDDPRSFINKPAWQRLLIIFAGPAMNFLLAIALFFIVFLVQGFPTNQNVIGEAIADLPAQQAGLRAGDQIVQIDGRPIEDWPGIVNAIKDAKGAAVTVQALREGRQIEIELQPIREEKDDRYIIGVRQKLQTAPLKSFSMAVLKTWDSSKMVVSFIPKLISGEVSRDNLAGPIGIARISGDAAREGPIVFLAFMAIISINLGIMNLLPIPALDGGRILLITLEIIFRRKLPAFIEEKIHLIGFALLMLLMLFAVYNDVVKLF